LFKVKKKASLKNNILFRLGILPTTVLIIINVLPMQAYVRLRNKNRGTVGPLPKTVEELVEKGVPPIFAQTYGDEPFLR
jgi:hypothetical protein